MFHENRRDAFVSYENPDYWRRRTEEARRRSEQVVDSVTRALLLDIADSYERIAKAYEPQPERVEKPPGTKEG